jgi:hypothetical protein
MGYEMHVKVCVNILCVCTHSVESMGIMGVFVTM